MPADRPPAPGLLLVDKPSDWTSHDVVGRIRRLAGTRKVGHAGTLDPMATGLLLVGIGSATRLLTYAVGLDKEYLATIRLGASTVTDDAQGEIVDVAPPEAVAAVTDERIGDAVTALTGDLDQVPSSVSAIKVDGRRSYARVRSGEDVALAARPITVSEFAVLDIRRGVGTIDVDARVGCSSGTYVRALARDLGAALGVGGPLIALRRTRVGAFRVEQATPLEELPSPPAPLALEETAAALLPALRVEAGEATALAQGKRLPTSETVRDGERRRAVIGPEGLVGIAEIRGGQLVPVLNMPTGAPS